jgi:hypothetical protein
MGLKSLACQRNPCRPIETAGKPRLNDSRCIPSVCVFCLVVESPVVLLACMLDLTWFCILVFVDYPCPILKYFFDV